LTIPCLQARKLSPCPRGYIILKEELVVMDNCYELALEAASFIEKELHGKPVAGIILGSGLGPLAQKIENGVRLKYNDIPNFPQTTVESHEGTLIAGMLGGQYVVALNGRFHYYEGYEHWQIIFPVRVLKLLGVENLLITSAVGGINEAFKPGDLMLISDHISFFAPSPLWGKNIEKFGERFTDMSEVYDRNLRELARTVAMEKGINLREGVYVYTKGPMFETPAEIRALKILGADAVGMSTVPEAIAAKHAGMKVLGISCITNMAAGLQGQLSHKEVIMTAKKVENQFTALITGIFESWK